MFACLLLPKFGLQAALRWRNTDAPTVIVDGDRDLVLLANKAALERQIIPGMSSAQAMARQLEVQILGRSPAQEECLNHLLVETALSLSAEVELTRDGQTVVDLRRPRPAPHCWQKFGDELVERFRREKLDLCVGIASTPDLAELAAKGTETVSVIYDGAAFAANLPLEALEPSAELRETLEDWGIRQVGGLLALPKAETVDRLGREVEGLLRKVSGREKRPLKLVRPETSYREAFEFEHEVENTEPLLFLLRRFLVSLSERLRDGHRVAERMALALPLENKTRYERSFAIPAPTSEVEALYRILDTHLEMLRLEHRPVGVQLDIHSSAPQKNQLGLFETAIRDLNGFGETLARLKALLGDDRVGVPRQLDTYQPDVFAMEDTFARAAVSGVEKSPRGVPLRRYRPALPARVFLLEAVPVGVESASVKGAIVEYAGPFRASGDWWDNDRWEIEEWDVEMETGGLYRLARRGGEWTVEGSYDEVR